MKRSQSPFNCNSIGQSLKRVKISTSPGELRLDKDIELLINENQWSPTMQNYVPIEQPTSWRSATVSSSRSYVELCRKNARLVRDPVDPLRLRLTCLHQPFSQSLFERWTYLIQMPRMYPHQAPLITRVTRELISNENAARISNVSIGASAAIVASSVMQMHDPPVPDQILIRSPPLPRNKYDAAVNREHSVCENSKYLTIDLETAMFNSWSPISSLGDLLDFLVAIPTKRREWWAVENNRLRHQQHLRLLKTGHEMQPHQTMSAVRSNESMEGTRGCSFPQLEHQVSSSSRGAESDDDHFEHMMDDSSAYNQAAADKLREFPSNRFDVGFPREQTSVPHWDMMQR
mmetsp:Transcript_24039/g.34376  ORF Transcript_24039/g.34376 Transcript_24039/m.34376 type:complete len:346 (+) Transcript_24039:294-1331(+)|eukprot:CAMPEP_0201689678 /NCGR_PEP_ID=MMETSP0578-20130828/3231_1 /ASSEMBLY_ACC=CAM_ASM_000663 /TAXON_ID=267565 /ORGANISM="Skeletonema grethea, Strain CCMP 1804" /LENGTH=345 /DNA_ID=CAMNT_0048174399 /DNA_START=217 /DNA_END=1254 /DNA_ORIENTATION=-